MEMGRRRKRKRITTEKEKENSRMYKKRYPLYIKETRLVKFETIYSKRNQ
uniref:Uncharacterized protein n=1 Tax=Octopus bimaculoides TaxID=37653 RepID=A0A0L8HBH7_OCTBM